LFVMPVMNLSFDSLYRQNRMRIVTAKGKTGKTKKSMTFGMAVHRWLKGREGVRATLLCHCQELL